ncbi:tumor protein p53-inducible protein 13 [Syngnathoides biaculeatus]|uniref:tumor protein p53-inducible protein 13 n=1 Tax=Syngnathoides biaculeatus TaxID=300417 RepID=UPI002ADD8776|nr:tumor protein p53-inducible protein 13 [Syngnathoides biaculeatus]
MPSHTVAVLAALWLTFCRYAVSDDPRTHCDNGKFHVERDLATDAVLFGCAVPDRFDSTQRLPSVDTVYEVEPARQVCMNEAISYRHRIPNSGAFRPVGAQSGEYLYCPPQRWLYNLHHGAAILLYHPCAASSERILASAVARSCLCDYVVTPHPHLNESTPVALVSWGRTLELSTAASSDLCDWLQGKTTSSDHAIGKYNFLLTRAAERRAERCKERKESVRQCCEEIISLWLKATIQSEKDSPVEKRNGQKFPGEGRQRQERAAVAPPREDVKANATFQVSGEMKSIPGSTHRTRLVELPETDARNGSQVKNATAEQSSKGSSTALGDTVQNGVIDVRERELAQGSDLRSLKGRAESAPSKQPVSDAAENCDGCTPTRRCDCVKDAEGRGMPQAHGTPPRPARSNEAVWAAAALGFLLVLLTLSVLHTRLYRHWRTMPSLYWHDPKQDYDSVADVIHRRRQIAKWRRNRGRRQECAVLLSSSSSDEYM